MLLRTSGKRGRFDRDRRRRAFPDAEANQLEAFKRAFREVQFSVGKLSGRVAFGRLA